MMIKAVFFDFDGTLVDSAPGIVKTMEQVFLQMGMPVPPEDKMRATIGLPLHQALQQLGNMTDEDADKATDLYRELFKIYEVDYVSVFPNIAETLAKLKEQGIRMAIVTSRDLMSLELIAEKRGLMQFFETQVTGVDGFKPKPAPDMVLALLDRMQVTRDEAMVVGDTTFDIEMGNGAGCKTVAVSYGNHSAERIASAGPTYIIHSFDELPEKVKG